MTQKPSIMQNEKACYVTGITGTLEQHHIFPGTWKRKASDKNGFWVWLTPEQHRRAHNDVDFALELKQECQCKYEALGHSREEFIRLIGRNYL